MWPIAPMKAVSGPLPDGPEWRFEPKWDGHRALVRSRRDAVAIASSSGADRTAAWSWLAEAVAPIASLDVVLDGEVIAIGPSGQHEFGLVGASGVPHAFVAFDVLHHRGRSLLETPWEERRHLLERIVEPAPMLTVTPVTEDGQALWEATSTSAFEGVVAKRRTSPYRPGQRSPSWIKAKHRFDQEFLVAGWLPRAGTTDDLGSLLLAVHDEGRLRFVGAAGSGLGGPLRARLMATLGPPNAGVARPAHVPATVARRARWVRPVTVVQIRHAGWTTGGRLRHPVVLGLREDVDPGTVTAAL